MTNSILQFNKEDHQPNRTVIGKAAAPVSIASVLPSIHAYSNSACPNDLKYYLLPDGSPFGMFSDPYATLIYIDSNNNRSGRFWLSSRMEDHSFTEREIRLIKFLAENRIATRQQIKKVVFSEEDKNDKVLDFLKKYRSRGVICAFSWVSPLNDGRKKPLVYGLTQIGVEAANCLFHKELAKDFRFVPISFQPGTGPNMSNCFIDLAANELYSELVRIDRVISWKRKPIINFEDKSYFIPCVTMDVIKDKNEIFHFWVEVVRTGNSWVQRLISRFERIERAYLKLQPEQRPARLIIIVDGDARIPFISELAHKYMPNVEVRYTTDERLLTGLNKETFLSYNPSTQEQKFAGISFFQEGFPGMTASEYYAAQSFNIENEEQWYEE
ncbi:replication-relaxation family protein [Aneurinibacillus thermoaerophilus]|uniref:replication-relaxation family protein n=1 Tax=Aneurinibacillus thermoaerophilus TaxID=143495 RepID=UPI002E1EAAE2|nr:replication-relaxation family protein [Aneurinibacillus thermoaerophilus]